MDETIYVILKVLFDFVLEMWFSICSIREENSVDPDQMASSEASWSGSTLFSKKGKSGFSRTRVKTNEAIKLQAKN